MSNFFDTVIGFFQYMYDFLVMSVGSLVRGIRLVYESYSMVSGVIGSLPSIIALSLIIVCACAVLKFILGRMTG